MSVQNTLIVGGILGAVVGVAASYIFFTEEGRQWREQAESTFDALAKEAERLLSAVDQVRTGVAELRSSTAPSEWQRTA